MTDLIPGLAQLRTTAGAVAVGLAFIAGVGMTEVYEHTFALSLGPVHIRALGPKVADAEADKAAAVANVQGTIDAPDTGWRARLAQCQANAATLDASLTRQNAAVDALRAAGDADTARAEKAASDARAVAESYRRQSAAIGAKPPQGVDVCSRVLDVDRKVVGSLK